MKLSVLIPFRNAAPFIADCVRSISGQAFADAEYVFLDDASSDSSAEVLAAELALSPLGTRSRILSHAENRGISQSRQELLDAAIGDYVIFIDADDVCEPGMFAAMVQKAEDTCADLVWADYRQDNRFGSRHVSQSYADEPQRLLDAILRGRIGGFLWNKLVRRDFIARHDTRFLPGVACQEDLAFVCELLAHSPRIAHLPAAHYRYRQWSNSAIRARMSGLLPSFARIADRLQSVLSSNGDRAAFTAWKRRLRFDAALAADVSATELESFFPEADGAEDCGFGIGKRCCHWLAAHRLRPLPCALKALYMRLKSLTLLRPPHAAARIQLVDDLGEDYNATTKAPADIDRIGDEMGFRRIALARVGNRDLIALIRRRAVRCVQILLIPFRVPRGAVLLFQFPRTDASSRLGFALLRLLRAFRRIRLITLVHDLNGMRETSVGENAQWRGRERLVMEWSDRMIVHNDRMADWLVAHGVARERIVVLGIFDYLCDTECSDLPAAFSRSVVIAGNLDTTTEKSRYIRHLSEIPADWQLYGPGFDPVAIKGGNVRYEGCVAPEDLPARLTEGFGLVWDGESIETCSGAYGDYLRLNNPHKLSLYLVSGLPVIIWWEAAEAEFVLKNDVGLAVRSLHDLPAALAAITPERYAELADHAHALGRKLRSGHFTRRALGLALSRT